MTASITAWRQLRLLQPARGAAKRLLVQLDVARSRRDPALVEWLPMCTGAKAGHIVVPSKAIAASRAEAANLAERGLLHAGDRVLDVGAGNGRQAIGLLEHDIAQYVGLDVVRESVEYGNRVFGRFGNVRFDWLDVANRMYNSRGGQAPEEVVFPYDDASFDLVIAGSLYTHLERIPVAERYLTETARVLVPGGRAYVSAFVDPPNTVTDSAVRTVFPRQDLLDAVGRSGLVVDATHGGESGGWHDQWQLYLSKPAG